MKYTFYAKDGSSISAVVIGEGMDSGDKASNKAMAVALKYALLQVFCIPTEDTKDPDADSHDLKNDTKPETQSELATLKTALIDYINVGAFDHPENVEAIMKANDIENMKRALAKAKSKEIKR
jgi:hypothetical protein